MHDSFVAPKPEVSFIVGEEEFQLVFAKNGAVKWKLKKEKKYTFIGNKGN